MDLTVKSTAIACKGKIILTVNHLVRTQTLMQIIHYFPIQLCMSSYGLYHPWLWTSRNSTSQIELAKQIQNTMHR